MPNGIHFAVTLSFLFFLIGKGAIWSKANLLKFCIMQSFYGQKYACCNLNSGLRGQAVQFPFVFGKFGGSKLRHPYCY